jgi:uncharacterized membrane protein YphA (DoxX/SURF4 family)
MKILTIAVRLLLGLVFVVFGLNAFLHFIKQPPPSGQAAAFAGAMFMSGYFYVVAICQIAGGALLLIGRFVALGLTILGPVIVNIVLFHVFLAPEGLPLASAVLVLEAFLIWSYRERFGPIFKP